jgi:signal transduction histidine kinase
MRSPRTPEDDDSGAMDAAARAVLEAASLFSLEPSLAAIAEGALSITGARFGAVGLAGPDPEEFSVFVTAGLTDAEIDAIGPLPRVHGLLGAVLGEGTPLRAADIRADPRASGWWPSAHPPMTALLGAPLRVGGAVLGAVYVANEAGDPPFGAEDEAALVRLADRAAPVVRALRQAEDGRLLVLSAERARIARDLHDALSQSLFSIGLRAEAARRDLTGAPERADGHLASIADTAREARAELGAVVEGLRPPAIDDEGLARALRGLAAVLDRLGEAHVDVDLTGEPEPEPSPARDREVFLILQEALVNAVRHAHAGRVRLTLGAEGGGLRAEVADDGVGFDPEDARARARRMGLNAMRQRAAALGAELRVESSPGRGARVLLWVPG